MEKRALALLERIRHFAVPDGGGEARATWLRQEGEMRLAPDRPWMAFRAEESFAREGIGFRWCAHARMTPLLRARVVDSFQAGRGALTLWVLGVLPIARRTGAAIDLGEALRALAELPWRPFSFREGQGLAWEAEGHDKLRVRFDDGRTQAAIDLDVDGEGRVLGGTAPRRPRLVGKAVADTPWSGAFGEYRAFGEVRVPTVAEATWHLPEGPFTYWRGRVTEFRVAR